MINNNEDWTRIQKLKALSLGNIISSEHIIKGINRLPKPPINIGIIIKKIINNPWNVMQLLYCNEDVIMNPGIDSSNLMINDKANPIEPPITPIIRYNDPMMRWLVDDKMFI